MSTFDILQMYKPMSAGGGRAFDRWITASAVIGSILAAGLVAMALVRPTAMRPGHVVTHGTEAPELSAAETPAKRSGILLEYQPVF